MTRGSTPPFDEERFERLVRLYGYNGVSRLAASRVIVFGLGGVGSFAAEALARSAIGHLMLVDFDNVCITNTNRQLQALTDTVGRSKALLMAQRLRLVNPDAAIEASQTAYDPSHSDALLTTPWPGRSAEYDFVVDCIDQLAAKAHLLVACRDRSIPVVSSMGAGGKTDPTRIHIDDLGRTDVCRLAHQLRKTLRQKFGMPRERARMGIAAVYSDEQGKDAERGTAAFVTGAFGLACAGHVVNSLIADCSRDG
jgi:tRNA threonylcarbamoyladenosine dehydratase